MSPPRPQSDQAQEHNGGDPPQESVLTLLAQLIHSCLLAVFNRVPIGIIDRIITVCALYAMAVPLLLWVSYSKTGFVILLCGAILAVGIIYLLIWLYPEDPF